MERAVARIDAGAVERNCARLDLWVLNWNPARRFYDMLGMRQMSDWLPYRLDGAGLTKLAAEVED